MTFDTMIIYTLLYISLYFEVFLLISFIANKKNNNKQKPFLLKDIDLPSVTIIVPCYNEEKTLAKTVRSLLALDYPIEKLSISVVNDGSTDKTLQIAHALSTKHTQVSVLDKKNGGKASAMNMALEKSNTELIGCLDADSYVKNDALRLIAKHFVHDKNVSAVTPAIMIANPKNILQYMQRAEYMMGVFMRKVLSVLDSIVVTPGPFSIFRRADILEVGPWKHAHGTEDFEMGLRLQSIHKKIANEPHARVMTLSPETLYSLYQQRIRWIYGFLMNVFDYKYMLGNVRYGNVGTFVLPTTLVSIFGAIYMFGIAIFHIFMWIFDTILRMTTTGIHLTMPSLELFYINISAMLFIVVALIGMILFILHNSAQLSEVQVHKKDTLLYLLLYGLVAPLWLIGATVRALFGKESKWRVIR